MTVNPGPGLTGRFNGDKEARWNMTQEVILRARAYKDQLIRTIYASGLSWTNRMRMMLIDSVDVGQDDNEREARYLRKRLYDLDRIEHLLISKGLDEPPESLRMAFEQYWKRQCIGHSAQIMSTGRGPLDMYEVHLTNEDLVEDLEAGGDREISLENIWSLGQ
jgi:hypothetical protein